MHIMLISGSIAEKSHTSVLMEELATALKDLDVSTTVWNLRDEPLPIADPVYHHEPERYPDKAVQRFIQAARAAHGFALGSPLYHGSFSGVLKNALDHLWYDAFRNKPVALLGHGSNERGCRQPCIALQPVVSTMFGYSVQTQIATGKGDFGYDASDNPLLENGEIRTRIQRQAEELVRLVKLLAD